MNCSFSCFFLLFLDLFLFFSFLFSFLYVFVLSLFLPSIAYCRKLCIQQTRFAWFVYPTGSCLHAMPPPPYLPGHTLPLSVQSDGKMNLHMATPDSRISWGVGGGSTAPPILARYVYALLRPKQSMPCGQLSVPIQSKYLVTNIKFAK
jgi:hypothetical protein